MTIIEPPSEGVKTPPAEVHITPESGGHTVTCACSWLRWFPARPDADAGQREHAKKCKGAPVKRESAAPKRAAAKWDDREGATWIDKL